LVKLGTTGFAPNLVVYVVGSHGVAFVAGSDGVTFSPFNVKVNNVPVTQTLAAFHATSSGILIGGGAMTLLHASPSTGNNLVADNLGAGLTQTPDVVDYTSVSQGSSMAIDSVGNALIAVVSDTAQPYTWNIDHTFTQTMTSISVQQGIPAVRVFAVGKGGAASIRSSTGKWTDSNTGVTQDLTGVYVSVDPTDVFAVGVNGTVLQYTGQ
jgi:hypothetical protein